MFALSLWIRSKTRQYEVISIWPTSLYESEPPLTFNHSQNIKLLERDLCLKVFVFDIEQTLKHYRSWESVMAFGRIEIGQGVGSDPIDINRISHRRHRSGFGSESGVNPTRPASSNVQIRTDRKKIGKYSEWVRTDPGFDRLKSQCNGNMND